MLKDKQEILDVMKHLRIRTYEFERNIDKYRKELSKKDCEEVLLDKEIQALKEYCDKIGVSIFEQNDLPCTNSNSLSSDAIDKAIQDAKDYCAPNGISIEESTKNSQDIYENDTAVPVVQPTRYTTFDELVELAHNNSIQNTTIRDILTAKETEEAEEYYADIDEKFSKATGILNKTDMTFLFVATGLQVARWVVANEIGEKFNPKDRSTSVEGDKDANPQKRQYTEENESKGIGDKSEKYKTWKEILTTPIPYDAMICSSDLGLSIGGKFHRENTLGHDKLLGWVFGTLNILTSTITLTDFSTYKVSHKGNFITEQTDIGNAFYMGFDSLTENKYRLSASLFMQGIHMKSDEFTKVGLPIPVLGVFSETIQSELYHHQYDALCFMRDAETIRISGMVSLLTDMIIGLVHGLWYDASKHESRKLYEVRTIKILLISHLISSTSNAIYCYITENPGKLDVAGLLVTIGHLFFDIRFIRKVKREFVEMAIDNDIKEEIQKLLELEKEFNTNF